MLEPPVGIYPAHWDLALEVHHGNSQRAIYPGTLDRTKNFVFLDDWKFFENYPGYQTIRGSFSARW